MKQLSFTDREAKEILEKGSLLALPTETVYGLAVRADDPLAYERLVKVKNRRPDKPIAVMCSKNFDLEKYFLIDEGTKSVIDTLLPGPLTILEKARENAPYQMHLGTFVAGIRIPKKQELLDFLDTLPFLIQVTSANLSGSPALTSQEEVYNTFDSMKEVEGIVSGTCESKIPTTVVSLLHGKVEIIRQGQSTKEEIEAVYHRR